MRSEIKKIIEISECDAAPDVFVIGVTAPRQTVFFQQSRALNLVHALFKSGRLEKGCKPVVIGGGIAGMTAAVAAAVRGAELVTLLERQPYLLHLQRGNHTRWLHPQIYDWPKHGSDNPETDFPFMNWRSATAGNVAEQLLNQWRSLIHHCGLPIDSITNVGEVEVQPGPVVSWNKADWTPEEGVRIGGYREVSGELVIIATGLGVEGSVAKASTPSYWRNDDLDQPALTARAGRRRILVSGAGDGGLIDVLRLRIHAFDHAQMIRDFFPSRDEHVTKVLDELRRLQDLVGVNQVREARDFQNRLNKIAEGADEGIKRIDARIKQRLRKDTEVILNGKSPFPLSPNTSLLNSFLVWRLLSIDVRYTNLEIGEVRPRGSETPSQVTSYGIQGVATDYEVQVNGDNAPSLVFDRVILRHGPERKDTAALGQCVADSIDANKRLGRIRVEPEFDKDDYIIATRWHITPKLAKDYLERLGFRRDSTELRNRHIRWCDDEGIPESEQPLLVEDIPPCPSDGNPGTERSPSNPWRAAVVAQLVERIRAQDDPFFLFQSETGFGAGMTLLWYRFMALSGDQIAKGNDVNRPACYLLDYSAAERSAFRAARGDGALREVEKVIQGLLTEHNAYADGAAIERCPIFILDNFSEGVRDAFKAASGRKPQAIVHQHITELANLTGENRAKFVIVLDEAQNAQALEGGLRDLVESELRAFNSAVDGEPRRLCAATLLNHKFVGRSSSDIEEHQESATNALEYSGVAEILISDVPRIQERFHSGDSLGRYRNNDSSKVTESSLFESVRPITEYVQSTLGFRAHPLFKAVNQWDEFLADLQHDQKELSHLAKSALQILDGSVSEGTRGGRAEAFKAEHGQVWASLGPVRNNEDWLTQEITLASFYVAEEMLALDVRGEGENRWVDACLGLLIAVSEVVGVSEKKDGAGDDDDDQEEGKVGVRLAPRNQVSPIAYSNLISVLLSSMPHLCTPRHGKLRWINLTLQRPILRVAPPEYLAFEGGMIYFPTIAESLRGVWSRAATIKNDSGTESRAR